MDLLVLAKQPVPGRVKTRLTPPCTPAEAAAIAEAALADTLESAVSTGVDRVILALDGDPGPWCPPGVAVVAQGGGDLAARLERAWRSVRGPALLIGMDTPHVGADRLTASMAPLEDGSADAVLGPAVDGGWWAIGLRRPRPGVFAGIPTSRPDTGARQRDRLAGLGLCITVLETMSDVDTWDDALSVAVRCPESRFGAAVRAVAHRTASVVAAS